MGVSIDLYVLPGGIDREAWEGAYEEVRRLWSAHPSGPRRAAWRAVCGVEVPMFVRGLEHEERGRRRLSIAGDVRSLRFAEPCVLPGWAALSGCRGGASRAGDVLFAGAGGRARLFGGKTRGEPYERLVLAAAMIVEARLPGRAFVAGGVDRAGAEAAGAEIASCLGAPVPLPVVVDAPALARRVAARREGAAFVASFLRRYAGGRSEGVGHALGRVDDAAADRWLRATWQGGARALERRGLSTRAVIAGWLRAGRPLEGLTRAAVDAGLEPSTLADEIARSGLLLPPHLGARARAALASPPGGRPDLGRLALAMARFSLERLELDVGLDEGQLEPAFAVAAPGQARALVARTRAGAAGLVGAVEDALSLLDAARRHSASLGPFQEEGEFVRLASLDDLEPGRRAAIERLVDAVYEAWRTPRAVSAGGGAGGDALPGTAPGLRRLFASAMARSRPTLTEDAWDAIAAERDVEVLRWLVRLALCEGPGDEALGLKRALLEGAALRREGARLYAERAARSSRRAPS